MAVASKPSKKKPTAGKSRGRSRSKPAGKQAVPAAEPDDVAEPDRSSPALAEIDADVLEFIAAIDRFKKEHGRPFPSWSEVLLVVRELGYRRR